MKPQSVVQTARPRTIAVIGAGAVGLSCAVYLQHAGYTVQIFDRSEPGEGASFGNAGVIATSEVLPLSRPSTLRQLPRMLVDPAGPLVLRWGYLPKIAPWLLRFIAASRPAESRRISASLASLLADATAAWREIVSGTFGEQLLISSGMLRLYKSQRELQAAMPDVMQQRQLGVKANLLNAHEIMDLEPALAPAFAGGVFYPDNHYLLSPLRMMQVLAANIVQNGGRILRCEVQRIEIRQGRPAVVNNAGMSMIFDRLVVAAGAWSRQIVRTLGIDTPLDTERGYHLMLPTPPRTLRRPVSVMNPGYSLTQMEEGMRLCSGIEFAGLSAPPDFRRIRRLLCHATTVLPGLGTEPLSEWLGFRPSMPRSIPLIGPLPELPQVILAFGHGHLGLTLGPVTGRIVAAVIDGRPPSIDVTPFLPRACVY